MSELMIRQVSRVAWAWVALFVASGTVFQGIDVQLPNPAWLLLPGASAHAFVPIQLLLISWGAVLVFIAWAFVNHSATRPGRRWPMVVLVILGIVGALFFGSLVTGGILLLGHTAAISAHAARTLIGAPSELVSGVAAAAALLSLIVVPGILELRRRARRRSPR